MTASDTNSVLDSVPPAAPQNLEDDWDDDLVLPQVGAACPVDCESCQ